MTRWREIGGSRRRRTLAPAPEITVAISCRALLFFFRVLMRGSLRLPSQSIYGSLGFMFLRSIAVRPIGSTASRSDYSSTEC